MWKNKWQIHYWTFFVDNIFDKRPIGSVIVKKKNSAVVWGEGCWPARPCNIVVESSNPDIWKWKPDYATVGVRHAPYVKYIYFIMLCCVLCLFSYLEDKGHRDTWLKSTLPNTVFFLHSAHHHYCPLTKSKSQLGSFPGVWFFMNWVDRWQKNGAEKVKAFSFSKS